MTELEPRRLLMTADAVGGVWQYAVALAAALHPLGWRTTLAVLGPAPSPEQRAEAAAVSDLTLVDTGLPLDWLCDHADPVLAAGEAIAALARELDADLVQLNMPTLAARARFEMPVVAVAHGCVTTWWEAAHGQPVIPEYRWHHDLSRAGLHAADRVVAPSGAYADTITRTYALARPAIAIHNGRRRTLPVQTFASADFAFTAGRLWDRVKGTDVLDRAAAWLSVPFQAAGAVTGPHGETATPQHLQLLGHLPGNALAAKLAWRPIFVSAARFEPFGLAVLEAANAGCPLVLSDIATFRELWDGAALFVDPDDAMGFTGAIEAIRADPELHAQLSEAARIRAVRYTPAATALAMATLFTDLASAPRRHAA